MTSLQVKTVCSLETYLFLVCAKYTMAWQTVFDERPVILAPIAANMSSPSGIPLVCKVSPQVRQINLPGEITNTSDTVSVGHEGKGGHHGHWWVSSDRQK